MIAKGVRLLARAIRKAGDRRPTDKVTGFEGIAGIVGSDALAELFNAPDALMT